jgi:hypothetical protein
VKHEENAFGEHPDKILILCQQEIRSYCLYPDDFDDLGDFADYINDNFNSFFRFNVLRTEKCVFPYAITEEVTPLFINLSTIDAFYDIPATLLTREEYDSRLSDVVRQVCFDCANYEKEEDVDNLQGHREKLCLDGTCPDFTLKTEVPNN